MGRYKAASYLNTGTTLLSKFNMSVCSLATCYWFIDRENEKTNNCLATIIAFQPPSLCT